MHKTISPLLFLFLICMSLHADAQIVKRDNSSVVDVISSDQIEDLPSVRKSLEAFISYGAPHSGEVLGVENTDPDEYKPKNVRGSLGAGVDVGASFYLSGLIRNAPNLGFGLGVNASIGRTYTIEDLSPFGSNIEKLKMNTISIIPQVRHEIPISGVINIVTKVGMPVTVWGSQTQEFESSSEDFNFQTDLMWTNKNSLRPAIGFMGDLGISYGATDNIDLLAGINVVSGSVQYNTGELTAYEYIQTDPFGGTFTETLDDLDDNQKNTEYLQQLCPDKAPENVTQNLNQKHSIGAVNFYLGARYTFGTGINRKF